MHPFHLAFTVKDITSTRAFYIDLLGCSEGRSTDQWIDFDFFGHQLSAHVREAIPEPEYSGTVDGVPVPMPHFGCILSLSLFKEIQNRLEKENITFIIKPVLRYAGQKGEQMTMFVLDFSGNPIEFKAFTHPEEIFAH